MVRAIFLACVLCVLYGCATKPEYKPPEIVYVKPAEPPKVERPELETQLLQVGDGPDKVIQAHRVDIKRLQKWGLELEAILDGYRTKETK